MLRIELDQEAPAAIRVVRPHQRIGRDLGERKHPEVSILVEVFRPNEPLAMQSLAWHYE
jgi:hypothetical protein